MAVTFEEFQRFQEDLLNLRNENYDLKKKVESANQKIVTLQKDEKKIRDSDTLDLKTNIINKLQGINNNSQIESLNRENQSLKEKLIQIESQFQLQNSTLIAECQRLNGENEKIKNLKSLQEHNIISQDHRSTQISTYIISSISQTEITSEDMNLLFSSQDELSKSKFEKLECETSKLREEINIIKEEKAILTRTIIEKEEENSKLKNELESINQEVILCKRNSAKANKDLKKQLAIALKKTLQSRGSQGSLSSFISTSPAVSHGSQVDQTSLLDHSNSLIDSKMFSEADLKGLLERLTSTQDENCSLQRHIYKLKEQLANKSSIIQRYMVASKQVDPNFECRNNNTIPVVSNNTGVISSMSDVLNGVLIRKEKLSSSVVKTSSGTPNEIHFLKDFCEELLTRNICLEESLEAATLEIEKLQSDLTRQSSLRS